MTSTHTHYVYHRLRNQLFKCTHTHYVYHRLRNQLSKCIYNLRPVLASELYIHTQAQIFRYLQNIPQQNHRFAAGSKPCPSKLQSHKLSICPQSWTVRLDAMICIRFQHTSVICLILIAANIYHHQCTTVTQVSCTIHLSFALLLHSCLWANCNSNSSGFSRIILFVVF